MMPMRLDHFSLRPADLDGMRGFLCDVVGLRVGERPPFKFPGYWLYGADDGAAIVHLIGDRARYVGESAAPGTPATDTGSVDHLALRGDDRPALLARLQAAGSEYSERVVPATGARQVFVAGPEGVVIEIVFPAEANSGG